MVFIFYIFTDNVLHVAHIKFKIMLTFILTLHLELSFSIFINLYINIQLLFN